MSNDTKLINRTFKFDPDLEEIIVYEEYNDGACIDRYNEETSLKIIYDLIKELYNENKEICKYIQRKINECDSPTKLDEIGVLTDPGASWGYCKALNQIKKGLQYRNLWVDDAE